MRALAMLVYAVSLACSAMPETGETVHNISPERGGPIHGYIASLVHGDGGMGINVPDVQVWAKNTVTGVASPHVRTNAAGYFHTPVVPPGTYNMCVTGPGFAQHCETGGITVTHSEVQLDHVVLIAPLAFAISGTVRLADNKTPCFWFRPAFDTKAVLQAKISLIDSGGGLIAGPVNGNSLGQYVLPVAAAPGTYNLRATCETSSGTISINLGGASLTADLGVGNAPPMINALNLTKAGGGVRRADPGDVLQATAQAVDPDGDELHYKWTDDSGRSLGLPDAPTVDWPLLDTPSPNTLRVQVSDGRGGFAVSSRDLLGGPNELLFAGTVLDRITGAPVEAAQVSLNLTPAVTDARGRFQVKVPDAPRFVLNIRKVGYALTSRVYYGRNTGMRIPLDPSVSRPLDASKGGVLTFPCQHSHTGCETGMQMNFGPGVLADDQGKVYTGTATIEAFQYDTSQMNPIPGDQGGTVRGTTVRLSTYGAFFIQPRDSAGNPLHMAPGKLVPVTMPIESALQSGAPPSIPLWRYDEDTGMWLSIGTLTRSGNDYVGQVNHFSAFNADTQFNDSACLKVILDPDSFTLPVYLDAHYIDNAAGQFYHNNTQVTANPIGIERMAPNKSFVLEVRDGGDNHLLKQVTLFSGPSLNPVLFPDGLVADPNFDACNGPVTVYNDAVLPTGPTYLLPITGGSITDNSVIYRTQTDADMGGSRDTFPHWLAANGFPGNDASAIYFNNGDLKFGRDMHCRVTATGTTACYVSNYGDVGTDDEVIALAAARAAGTPVATVTMEYDPNAVDPHNAVQFWAYQGDGSYLSKAALDGQGAKPLPDICLGCHYGYFDGNLAADAQFLPFDVASFHYDTLGDPHAGSPNAATVQEQFRQLNKLVLDTTATAPSVQPGYQQLMNMWYPGAGGVATPGHLFSFTSGAAQLSGAPFSSHESLYDDVVAVVCRTCHISHGSGDNWTSFGQMNAIGMKTTIQHYACGTGMMATHDAFNFSMPHAEVPFKKYWTDSLSSTLSSQLGLAAPGCPNN